MFRDETCEEKWQENTFSSSRQLLSKYLAKNRHVPPAIFQTSLNNINNCLPAMLYDDGLETDTSSNEECNRITGVKFVDNSGEALDSGNLKHSSIISIDTSIPSVTKATFHTMSKQENIIDKPTAKPKCRLIGKVDPKIMRTWEQLNFVTMRTNCSTDSDSNINAKQSFTLFCRKRYNLNDLGEKFEKIPDKRAQYAESACDDFFDSIDDKSLKERLFNISKNLDYQDIDSNMYKTVYTAGEGMAHIDSLEKHEFCWSIDDDK